MPTNSGNDARAKSHATETPTRSVSEGPLAPLPLGEGGRRPGEGRPAGSNGNGHANGRTGANGKSGAGSHDRVALLEPIGETPAIRSDQFARFQLDAPSCDSCGAITVRSGNCYLCHNCGQSMGCS